MKKEFTRDFFKKKGREGGEIVKKKYGTNHYSKIAKQAAEDRNKKR